MKWYHWALIGGGVIGAAALFSGGEKTGDEPKKRKPKAPENGSGAPLAGSNFVPGPPRTYEEVVAEPPPDLEEDPSVKAYVDAGRAVSYFGNVWTDLWAQSLELFSEAGIESIITDGACDEPCEYEE